MYDILVDTTRVMVVIAMKYDLIKLRFLNDVWNHDIIFWLSSLQTKPEKRRYSKFKANHSNSLKKWFIWNETQDEEILQVDRTPDSLSWF